MSVKLVNEAIKLCKAEEARVNETIQQYKTILRSMKTLLKDTETQEASSLNVKDDDIPLQEKQDIELLEQVLKKALKVRGSSAVTRDSGADRQEKLHGGLKGSCTAVSKASVNGTLNVLDKRKLQSSSHGRVQGSRHPRGGSVKSVIGREAICTRPVLVKRGASSQHATRGKRLAINSAPVQAAGVDDQNKSCKAYSMDSAMAKIPLSTPPHEQRVSVLDKELKTRSPLLFQKEQWVPSPLLPVWKGQRAKKDRMWNKVLSRHSRPVPERDHFKQRLISTFPTELFPSAQAVVEATELDTLVQLGMDLTHCYHAELQGHQPFTACMSGRDPETSMEKEYESLLMLEGLEEMMAKVIKRSSYLKKEWERKSEGLEPACALRWRCERPAPGLPHLPPVLAYSSQAELEELTALRLRVNQLRLEVRLHQAMCDTVSPCPMDRQPSAGSPSATVLRGAYSLLGEGGAQFPVLVLDSGPHRT